MHAELDPNTVRNILVIHVCRIGDTILTTPVLRALAAAYPKARITCLAHPKRFEVLQHLPCVQKVGTITKKSAPFLGYFSGKIYDLALVFGIDQALFFYAFRVSYRVIGFRQNDDSINQKMWKIVKEPGFQDRHVVDHLLTFVDALNIPRSDHFLSYQVTAHEAARAKAYLQTLNIQGKRLIGLQIASFFERPFRDWPVESFIRLCDNIKHEYQDVHFLILGGKRERKRTALLQQALAQHSTNMSGQLTIRKTTALMNCLDLYIGVDTGPTHIMSSLHRPMIVLYSGLAPSFVAKPLEHPCAWIIDPPGFEKNKPREDFPITHITVPMVMALVHKALRHVA